MNDLDRKQSTVTGTYLFRYGEVRRCSRNSLPHGTISLNILDCLRKSLSLSVSSSAFQIVYKLQSRAFNNDSLNSDAPRAGSVSNRADCFKKHVGEQQQLCLHTSRGYAAFRVCL